MAVNIGLNAEQRAAAAKILNRVLADTFVVYAKTRGFHWNVTGLSFMELHRCSNRSTRHSPNRSTRSPSAPALSA